MKTPVGLVTAALAVAILLAVSFLIATGTRGEAAGVRLVGGRTRGSDHRQGPRQSLGAGVPARRHDAGDRASGPHAHRHERRTGLAAAQGRARGVGVGPGRPARRRRRQILCAEQDRLFLLCRADRGRWTHRGRARQTQRRQGPARRRQDHLPPAGAAVIGQSLRLPHRAGRRRQSVRHAGRAFRLPRSGAKSRQSSRQGDPDRARWFGAIRQSVRRPRRRQAGDLELRPSQSPSRSRSIPPPASSGKSSTARAAATRSI